MSDYWDRDIVDRLRTRAAYAKEEKTGTADGDAVHLNQAADEIERLRAQIERMTVILRGIAGWKNHRLFADEPWQMSDMGNAYSCGSTDAFSQCATLAEGALALPATERERG